MKETHGKYISIYQYFYHVHLTGQLSTALVEKTHRALKLLDIIDIMYS